MGHIIGGYVRGDVCAGSTEKVFPLFRRGTLGQFHKVSAKRLQRYLDECAYRFNRRSNLDAFGETVRRLYGFQPLTFASLTSDEETPF